MDETKSAEAAGERNSYTAQRSPTLVIPKIRKE